MADVFISYARADIDFVRRLYEALEKHNHNVWVDIEDIRITADWTEQIYSSIDNANALIFVMSPNSITSRTCQQELGYAESQNKRIIPVMRREVDDTAVPGPLRSPQWIFFRDGDDFEDSLRTLIEALNVDLDWVHAHTRLLTRAIEWDNNGRDDSFVLRGSDLRTAEEWQARAADKEPKPTRLQSEYILASRNAATRRQIVSSVVVLSISVLLAVPIFVIAQVNQPFLLLVLTYALGLCSGAGVLGVALRYRRVEAASDKYQVSPEEADTLRPETIFISYSHKDCEKYVKDIVILLRNNGLKVWIDESQLDPGEVWRDEIEKALETCQRMVLCASQRSLNSKHVKDEYQWFLEDEKQVVPLKFDKMKLPFGLRSLEYATPDNLDKLVHLLKQPSR